MKVEAVIGADYGDEGKGLFTDYLCANRPNPIIVMTNSDLIVDMLYNSIMKLFNTLIIKVKSTGNHKFDDRLCTCFRCVINGDTTQDDAYLLADGFCYGIEEVI